MIIISSILFYFPLFDQNKKKFSPKNTKTREKKTHITQTLTHPYTHTPHPITCPHADNKQNNKVACYQSFFVRQCD